MTGTVSAHLKNGSGDVKYDLDSTTTLLVPSESTPSNLSDLVNHLLNSEDPVPFRFFFQGVLLRGPLVDLLSQLEHSLEAQVTLEYTPATKLPEIHTEQQCPDWIRSVKSGNGGILTGSFDSIARLHAPSTSSIIRDFRGHRACITTVGFVEDGAGVLTGSGDWTLRWWDRETAECKAVLKGHEAAIQCVAYDEHRRMAVSGDMNGRLAFWALEAERITMETERPGKKKARTKVIRASSTDPTIRPLALLDGHGDGCVSGLAYQADTGRILSAGLDHRLHTWDMERRARCSTLTLANQVSSMALASSLLALGSPDGHLRLIDTRSMKASGASHAIHAGWVNGLAWSPEDENLLCSIGADFRVCIWDRRGLASGPLRTLGGVEGGKKMLGLDWSADGIFYGGEDCTLHHWL
jgi:ribosome biogenesis protein YTM1